MLVTPVTSAAAAPSGPSPARIGCKRFICSPLPPSGPGAAGRTASQPDINPNLHRAGRRSPAPCLLLPARRTAVWTGPRSRRCRTPSRPPARSHSPAGRRRYRTGERLETPEETSRPYRAFGRRRLPCWFLHKVPQCTANKAGFSALSRACQAL